MPSEAGEGGEKEILSLPGWRLSGPSVCLPMVFRLSLDCRVRG